MNLNFLGCQKYKRLSYQSRDRDLTESEVLFMRLHEEVCHSCKNSMAVASVAFNLLRDGELDAEPAPNFEARTMRRYATDRVRQSFGYWSPAVFGAAVAGLVILAALQMITQSSRLPTFKVPGGEARLSAPAIPSLHSLDFRSPWQ